MQTLKCDVTPQGVARVEMTRPQVFNAFDETMICELDETFTRLGNNPSVRAIVRELTAQTISRVRMTPEAEEGFAAFFAKRPPAWMTNQ